MKNAASTRTRDSNAKSAALKTGGAASETVALKNENAAMPDEAVANLEDAAPQVGAKNESDENSVPKRGDAANVDSAARKTKDAAAETAASQVAASTRVCAIVVTFNRRDLLRECLSALHKQTRAVEQILVVDNASSDGTRAMLESEFPAVRVLALAENVGGAGGFHAGMEAAYDAGFDWLWLMDDDGQPAQDCLEKLLERASPGAVMIPVQQGRHGAHGILGWRRGQYIDIDVTEGAAPRRADYQLLFTFVGPLISRAVVAKVGLPNKDFFIWFDDFEYAFRIRRKTKARFVVVREAHFFHEPGIVWNEVRLLGLGRKKSRRSCATWRAYYMARNSFYTLLRTHRRPRETTLFLLRQLRVLAAVLLYDADRWPRARMQLRGLWDGALGRLGKRV